MRGYTEGPFASGAILSHLGGQARGASMPELLRSATLSIPTGIDLPMSPKLVVKGRGVDGKPVCQLEISATGVVIRGPKRKVIRKLNWDELVDLASSC
jgi:hypothetical protein